MEVIKIKIILSEFDTGDYMTFPMLPEAITVECGTRFQSYDIMSVGEIKIPLGEELTRFSWKCKIPGEKRQIKSGAGAFLNPFIIVEKDPHAMEVWFSYLRNSNIKCKLLITETPVNHSVYLESYKMTYAGGYGDYECDISFIHAKELKVYTEGKKGLGEKTRPSKGSGCMYTVKKGDTLWDIARKSLGKGSRYGEIASLNKISNPNKISVGQTLILPKK